MPWRFETHEEIPSTQDIAIAAAIAGAPGNLAVLAARQVAGRGRDGRVWQAPEGNLNLSVLIRPKAAPPVPAQWSLMAGLAVHEAVAGLLPDAGPLTLKWPNDLLLNGAKLAGVLIDSSLTPNDTLDWVVIGIGANLREAPNLPDRATTSLTAHGIAMTPTHFAPRILKALDHWSAQTLPTIREAWLVRGHPPGTRLRVRQGTHVIEGAFETLAPDGSLILRGHPPIPTGEITLEAPDVARR
jgi:BirA family biotin operon repressor/biotin-[acetyl-CoA-carboxylase] ligase